MVDVIGAPAYVQLPPASSPVSKELRLYAMVLFMQIAWLFFTPAYGKVLTVTVKLGLAIKPQHPVLSITLIIV